MVSLNTKLRKVGNSLGIVVPSNIIKKENLKENENITIEIKIENKTTVEDMIKAAKKMNLKFNKSTQEMLDEGDKELE